jgi:hypothetical protein
MPSTRSAFPQVVSRSFTYFRVLRFRFSAGQGDFVRGSIPGSSTAVLAWLWRHGCFPVPCRSARSCLRSLAVVP